MISKKVILSFCGIILMFSLINTANSAGDKIKLRLHLKKGESYGMQMVADQKISQTIQGQKQDMNQTIGMGYKMYVEDVDASGIISIDLPPKKWTL